MPNRQKHRGKHPQDDTNFGNKALHLLRSGVHDLSQLLEWGYAESSALKLVGDRYQLNVRQRQAVSRSSCGASQAKHRQAKRQTEFHGATLWVDAFNQIISVEAALAGAYLFRGRDGVVRDLASVHGSYRRVEETEQALILIGETCEEAGIDSLHWLIDRPVSNSGKLLSRLYALAGARNWNWQAEVVYNPDRELVARGKLIATTDSWILDESMEWMDLSARIIEEKIPTANLINLYSG